MRSFTKLNVIIGWLMFLVALVVYTLTLEPSVSLWDCGEFASAAYKLQVVHPPGAPFFLMVGRLFSLLASDPTSVGFWINMLSAVSSAGAVMFTYWITTYFADKLVEEDNDSRNILIYGAGVIAALTNTFIDTFWFSAVEAEVYAMSSFFTSLTFWAVLKWYKMDDNKYTDRWIVFIAFMIGLALGTHMLNLLVIPTVCLAYYFKKYTVTRNGVIMALGAAAVALAVVMKIIYPGIPWLIANLDKAFVNGMGMPFYSGAIFAVAIVFAAVIYLVHYTHKRQMHNLNVIILSVGFIIFGYSSYAMVIIRSMANTAIDMNNPEDPYKFYGYITREQYGDRPLAYGPYFNAPQTGYNKKGTRYFKSDEKYEKGGDIIEPTFEAVDIDGNGVPDDYNTLFPRMGRSGKPNDARGYRLYGGMDDVQTEIDRLNQKARQQTLTQQERYQLQLLNYQIPSFSNNMTFFVNYQIRYMYLRYFMWNFVGRFNDQQATSGNTQLDGNWYSGIPFIDNWIVGDVDELPDFYNNQKARNAYYFLPLILGLLGLVFQYGKKKKDFWLIMTMFIFTGILIIVYTNQPPYEPRERDYAVVGSFQIFCIWVGLGVLSVAKWLKKYAGKSAAIISIGLSILLVPVNMAAENWDDHDRSGRYIGIDMAKNFLLNLEPNAILFCNGDNDTYPLWYAQNVEGIRTDVRIINQSLLPTEWYSSVLLDTVNKSTPLPLTLTKKDLQTGSFDYGIMIDTTNYPPQNVGEVVAGMLALKEKQGGLTDGISWKGKQIYVPVNKEEVLKAGVVDSKDASLIVDSIAISLGGQTYLDKGDLLMYDLVNQVAQKGWKRPIYFTSVSGFDFKGLNDYLELEGLVYKLVPIKGGSSNRIPMRTNYNKLYNNLVHTYKYYQMKEKANFFLDDKASYVPMDIHRFAYDLASHYVRQIDLINQINIQMGVNEAAIRQNPSPEPGYANAGEYFDQNKDSTESFKNKAKTVLDHVRAEIPEKVLPLNRDLRIEFANLYLSLGAEKEAKELFDLSIEENRKYFNFYYDGGKGLDEPSDYILREIYTSKQLIQRAFQLLESKGKKQWVTEYKPKVQNILDLKLQ